MNRRERLENKLAKRREWAEKAEQRSRKEWEKSEKAVEGISFGQPILVGHHSEKRHRAAVARAQAAGTRAVEESNLAKHHLEKAAGLSDYLENTIFDDDPDAIEKVEQKIARLEKEHEFMLAVNKICRNRKLNEAEKISAIVALGASEESARKIFAPEYSWQSAGFESWALSNNSANIRRYKERLATMKARRERQAVRIEALEAENKRLREALKEIAELANNEYWKRIPDPSCPKFMTIKRYAEKALKGVNHGQQKI